VPYYSVLANRFYAVVLLMEYEINPQLVRRLSEQEMTEKVRRISCVDWYLSGFFHCDVARKTQI